MKANKYLFFFMVTTLLFFSASVMAENFKDFAELDLEELLNTEVISASKRVQKISESPNAISVITAEDIKRSGAVDLPDLFRTVPGLDVVNVYGGSYGVSARGFNERYARRMLILIDGRSIYTTFFGGVFWENEQVFLEDIERIEIIRGPGATLWGANAVNGVISIITKDPEKDQGFMVTGKFGSKNFRENVTRYSDTLSDKFSFSLTGGYREDEGARGVNDYLRVPKAAGRAKYKLSDDSALHFFAGFNESEMGLPLSTYTPQTDAHVRNNYQMMRLEHQFSETSQFHFQAYRNHYEVHGDDKQVDVEEDEYVIGIQHSFALGKRHNIIWGGNYGTTEVDSSYLDPKSDHDYTFDFFLQDELKIFDNLKFVSGVNYGKNSFTGGDWSPRGCILYSPWPDQHFRLSVSKAFQIPSFAKDSFHQVQTLPTPLPAIPLALVVGNEHLDPEEMTAFEFGYRTTLFKKIGLNIELYYNEIDDVIDHVILKQTWPFVISWGNKYDAIAKGIEVALECPITPWWKVTANYTFQEVEYKKINKDVPGTPKHKFNIGSSFTFKSGFSLDVIAHYVDETKWNLMGLIREIKVDDYVRLDIRISQKLFNDKLELSFVGQNLTDKLHPETYDGISTYEIERLLYGQITLRF